MKKLVCGCFGTIYYATILKSGIMGNQRVDVTKDAINAVAEHMMQEAKLNKDNPGTWCFRWKGIGTLTFKTESEE